LRPALGGAGRPWRRKGAARLGMRAAGLALFRPCPARYASSRVQLHMHGLCRGQKPRAGYMTPIRDAVRRNGRIRLVMTRRLKGSTSPIPRRQIAGNTGSA
jgi:hypothetical protein